MVDLTDAQRRDVLMLRGLNKSYDEIAASLNAAYGLSLSGSAVGRVVRALEDEADATTPQEVFHRVVLHGFVDDALDV